jgi:hypothetical protein
MNQPATPITDDRIAALIDHAEEALYWLRNGGEDDPYLTVTDEQMDAQRAEAKRTGGDWSPEIRIEVADGCHFCTVADNGEGEPCFNTAEQIAGAGKLIADLVEVIEALRANNITAMDPVAICEHLRGRCDGLFMFMNAKLGTIDYAGGNIRGAKARLDDAVKSQRQNPALGSVL